jgi:glycosyltransferase involved in cell wall biosynthesis
MANVLLTVSGVIPPDIEAQIAAGQRPRADYLELARALDADWIDYTRARETGWGTRLVETFAGSNSALAWACFRQRHRYRLIFTDGEQVGIPLALLLKFLGRGLRDTRHVMIVHIVSVGKKRLFFDWLGIQSHIDCFLVYSTWQKRFIQERWRVPPERVIWTPFQVDARFFRPDAVSVEPEKMICSAGLEFRDYPTLMEAVEGLDVQVVLAAASPWSKRADTTTRRPIPPNVTVRRFSLYELRDLYARSRFVVVPLYPVNFQAGVTTILEAMAMGKAVIVTRTPGQTDVVIEGETGLYVPPGDPQAMRAAIQYLLDHPDEAARLGANGRRLVEERMNLDRYVEGLKKVVEEVSQNVRCS